MAATTLANIRAGLKTNLEAVFTDWQVNAYERSSPTPPCFEIALDPGGVEFNQASNLGLDLWRLIVRGIVGTATDEGAQRKLDALLDTSNVRNAIEADRTLGGVVHNLKVTGVSGYRTFAIPSQSNPSLYLAAEWSVEIYAAGR